LSIIHHLSPPPPFPPSYKPLSPHFSLAPPPSATPILLPPPLPQPLLSQFFVFLVQPNTSKLVFKMSTTKHPNHIPKNILI
jgi:hypothetical protein